MNIKILMLYLRLPSFIQCPLYSVQQLHHVAHFQSSRDATTTCVTVRWKVNVYLYMCVYVYLADFCWVHLSSWFHRMNKMAILLQRRIWWIHIILSFPFLLNLHKSLWKHLTKAVFTMYYLTFMSLTKSFCTQTRFKVEANSLFFETPKCSHATNQKNSHYWK